MRLSEGYRAKIQFLCKTSGMEDQSSWVDIDITMRQILEANKIQFLTRKKVCFSYEEYMFFCFLFPFLSSNTSNFKKFLGRCVELKLQSKRKVGHFSMSNLKTFR